jgi:curved DNA-binding protein CbpA
MDSFARLGLPRQPWFEPDLVQSQFLSLSTQHHPDRFPNSAEKNAAEKLFAEINTAHQTLRSNSARVAHLLQLETGENLKHVQEIPPEAMAFFNDVAKITRGLDKFLSEKNPDNSPMLNVYYFERAIEWTDIVQELQTRITAQIRKLEEELKLMNPAWESAPPPAGHSSNQARANVLPIARLRSISGALSFLEKWNAQLHEKLALLAQIN